MPKTRTNLVLSQGARLLIVFTLIWDTQQPTIKEDCFVIINGHVVSQLEYFRVIGCLINSAGTEVLEENIDASWISNTEDNLSTSGWVFLLGGGAISWASKKQTCITGSTMESEFVALAAVGKEAEWLKNMILDIPLWSKPITPIFIRCDSAATLAKAYMGSLDT
ncbi:zinc finger, CCHC-type containing protein [Tanacetum coccineum]|uniref:Zinc finger, CCHC-type containing protein n=1 Tax=Tanacetum coccineum TaxID=301880 RepID=A0ABQ5C5V9_9ASTR